LSVIDRSGRRTLFALRVKHNLAALHGPSLVEPLQPHSIPLPNLLTSEFIHPQHLHCPQGSLFQCQPIGARGSVRALAGLLKECLAVVGSLAEKGPLQARSSGTCLCNSRTLEAEAGNIEFKASLAYKDLVSKKNHWCS
jgi:hypothetical protein